MKQITILTTKQNYVWSSMQEVIPAIEFCWSSTKSKSLIVNVDEEPLRKYLPFILQSNLIILIAYNETIAKVINYIRGTLKLEIPIVLHLYGHATLGLWPQKRFGTLDLLTLGDLFIGTCNGDLNCMDLTLQKHQTEIISYSISNLENENLIPIKKKNFAYIGRISDQKNIHILIQAYSILYNRNQNIPDLLIFGKEDYLGFPNLGLESTDCLKNIEKLINELKLNTKIKLLGHKTREEIYQQIGKQHIFLSASTHSDENFGMAALRTLMLGGNAVLSNWGGHQNFMEHFPTQVKLVDINFDNNRPLVNAVNFANKMEESLQSPFAEKMELPTFFSNQSIISQFQKIIDNLEFNQYPIIPTKNAEIIFSQQEYFESKSKIQQAFDGFNDPILQKYYKAYK